MVEDDRYCVDILNQTSAIRSAAVSIPAFARLARSSAMQVVSGPRWESGRFLAYFQWLNRPSEILGTSRAIREWVANQKGSWHSNVIVIAEGGGGEMLCLRYGADGRAEPEVWWLNAMMPTLEEGFYKMADTFDEFIEKLITDDEYVRLGFEL